MPERNLAPERAAWVYLVHLLLTPPLSLHPIGCIPTVWIQHDSNHSVQRTSQVFLASTKLIKSVNGLRSRVRTPQVLSEGTVLREPISGSCAHP